MTPELLKEIDDAVEARNAWAKRQRTFYAMRNGTLSRASKPYPGAPDLHYPLGDTMIEKLKPAYIQQMYGGENMVTFVGLTNTDQEVTSSVAAWYDYLLKHRSNYERTMFMAIDQMLEIGHTPVKVRWDSERNRLSFDQIDPLHLIIPDATQEYNEGDGADWMVHVLHMSEAQYRANKKFKQDDDFIERIKGKGKDEDSSKRQEKDLKEGINCSANKNEIVLWEVYNRDRETHKITVETVSRLLGDDDNAVRDPFGLTFNKGCFKTGEYFPFFKIQHEITGKRWNASRGIVEINGPFEGSLTKNWNTIHEWGDFFAKPMFQNTGTYQAPTAQNWKAAPGKIMPPGLVPMDMPAPPAFLREDMEMTRAIAEDRTQVPNLGQSEHLSGNQSNTGKVTATQINAIVGQSSQGSGMKAKVFQLGLAEGHKIAYSILIQFAMIADDESGLFNYLQDETSNTIDKAHLVDNYCIIPNGSADNWNKAGEVQKWLAYYQTFLNNPHIKQDEMTKVVLEKEDARWVRRLFQDPQTSMKDQEQKQMLECIEIVYGYVPEVQPADDDKTHLMMMDQFAMDKIQKQEMTPDIARGLIQHGAPHMDQLKEKKDPMLKQVEAKLTPTFEMLAAISAQQGPQPGNVINLQQAGGSTQTQGQPAQPETPAASSSNQDKPSAVLNALAACAKAGLPIPYIDWSQALTAAGLPPLTPNSAVIPQPAATSNSQADATAAKPPPVATASTAQG